MHVEIALTADVNRVVGLVNDAYRGSSKKPGWTHETALITGYRTDAATVSAMLDRDDSTVLVMKHEGNVVACVALELLDNSDWYLSLLAVDPEHQKGGLGKQLMAGAERFAVERGALRIKISVINVREALLAWYERQGYVRTGAVEPFPYDDATVGTPLRSDLALITLTKTLRPIG
jgi:ribosomal protein S18 acetylase RimI-like enzyme